MNYAYARQQIVQPIYQTNSTETNPWSTERDYTQIHSDLLQLREVHNSLHDYGKLLPIPMNGKTWEEERTAFYDSLINAFNEKLRGGVISTCEIRTEFEATINHLQNKKHQEGIWNHLGYKVYDSSQYEFKGQGVTVDDAIFFVEKIISGSATEQEKKKIDNLLNNIGTSACETRAEIDERFYEFKDTTAKDIDPKKTTKSTSFSIT